MADDRAILTAPPLLASPRMAEAPRGSNPMTVQPALADNGVDQQSDALQSRTPTSDLLKRTIGRFEREFGGFALHPMPRGSQTS
jgi:hypothetical protein